MNFPYTFTDQELAWIQAVSGLAAVAALLLSALAVYITIRIYWQKIGFQVRGSYYVVFSSVATDHRYVKEVMLENLKDRSVVIFGVYFRLSSGYLIEIERFDESPLILKPFEVTKRTYGPPDFYSVNNRKLNLNPLFDLGSKRRNYLVLSTPDGKVKVKRWIKKWDPMWEWFWNHLIVTAQIQSAQFHGNSYGSNLIYFVELKKGGKLTDSMALYPRDFELKRLRDLGATPSSFDTKESLGAMLAQAIAEGRIDADDFLVHDAKAILEKRYENYVQEPFEAMRLSWFTTHFIGRFATWRANRELAESNKEAKRKQSLQQTQNLPKN